MRENQGGHLKVKQHITRLKGKWWQLQIRTFHFVNKDIVADIGESGAGVKKPRRWQGEK